MAFRQAFKHLAGPKEPYWLVIVRALLHLSQEVIPLILCSSSGGGQEGRGGSLALCVFHSLPRPGLGHTLGCCLPLPTFSFLLPWATGLLVSALSEARSLTWAGLPGSREALW